jgi:phosphoglycolate phosphatase
MTLVDSAAGIAASLGVALAEQGLPLDAERFWPLVGLPLEDTLLALAPAVDLARAVPAYRRAYPQVGAPAATLLPGAAEAIAAVHGRGGRVLVVSAKIETAVRAVLQHVGLAEGPSAPDQVAGGRFAAAKAPCLVEAGASAYVGDHPGDLEAARIAGAVAVGVATGPHGPDELRAAGADVVLPDLTGFPAWLDGWLDGRLVERFPVPASG